MVVLTLITVSLLFFQASKKHFHALISTNHYEDIFMADSAINCGLTPIEYFEYYY